MKINQLKKLIENGGLDSILINECSLVPEKIKDNYLKLCDSFSARFGEERDVYLLSVGGRTEVSGNHTDHNKGKVMAAAVNLELVAVAAKRDDGVVCVKSEGFPEDVVESSAVDAPDKSKFFTSGALIAGMEKAFCDKGLNVGGFDAYTISSVLKGSGLSSSAAFEVMIGNILNHLYNDGKVDNVEIAKMAQFAENVYFGKPCGLMDQMACAVGGFIAIDFEDTTAPKIRKLDFDLNSEGYSLCIINTGGNHADLNEDYASVPAEMKAVAKLLGHEVLRQCTKDEIVENVAKIRSEAGDRAFLRAMHFAGENERVDAIAAAFERGDVEGFLSGVKKSGDSSFKYLQNVYTTKNVAEQGISLALCLAENYLADKKAAWRVHGGGFAGTIQVFVPINEAAGFVSYMEKAMGEGSCHLLCVRGAGAICLVK
ncbi:MAG: galactokinase [Clostridia bacterium]|nr:galactokinase [Clostridia bacterium]